MTKEKDPAFLFYPKDWLQGTSSMMPDEKGIYIDLLAHQHQDGDLPNDTKRLARMVGLSESEFLPIWNGVKKKFFPVGTDRIRNKRLTKVVTERSTKSITNTITGTLAALIRKMNDPVHIKKRILETFNSSDFLDIDLETDGIKRLRERLTVWYENGKESIAHANVNATEDVFREESMREGGWNSKPGKEELALELDSVKAGAVIELFKFTKNHDLTEKEVSGLWSIFKKQNFTGSKFYADQNEVYSHFINWSKTQNINGTAHKPTSTSNGGRVTKSSGAEQLVGILKEEIGVNVNRKEGS